MALRYLNTYGFLGHGTVVMVMMMVLVVLMVRAVIVIDDDGFLCTFVSEIPLSLVEHVSDQFDHISLHLFVIGLFQ